MAEYPKKLSIMTDFWHPSFFSLLSHLRGSVSLDISSL